MARRRLGQHFLEPAWADRVVACIGPQPEDQFVEIGPGRGALTLELARRCASLVAIEIDRRLAHALQARVPANTQVIAADFLELAPDRFLGPEPRRVAGNLPYNVATVILRRLLTLASAGDRIRDATVMLQREVAARVMGRPGTRDYGPLAIAVALHADVEPVLELPAGAFRPAPQIRSTLVRLAIRAVPLHLPDRAVFDRLVRQLFTQRRKVVLNALRPLAAERQTDPAGLLERAGVDPRRRPDSLDLTELASLSEVFASARKPDVL